MLTFKTGPSLAHSTLIFMGSRDSVNDARKNFSCYLFSGPVPASLDDVPFDIHNPFELSRHAEAMTLASMNQKTEEDAATLQGDHSVCAIPVKRSVLDTRRNAYRLAPRYTARYDLCPEILIEDPGYGTPASRPHLFPNQSPGELDQNSIDSYRYQFYYGNMANWYNEKYSGSPGNNGNNWSEYGVVLSGRYGLSNNQGIFMEFEQDVTVDAFELRQYSNTSYTSAQWTLEYWDEDTSSWVAHFTNDTNEVNLNSDQEFYVPIPPITASKFILSPVNTGANNCYIRHASLLSNSAPYNVETVDLTWALIYPTCVDISSPFTRSETESYSQVGRLPIMMTSVGDVSNSDHTIVLGKATGLPGYFFPRILNLNFEFSEPEVNV